MNSRSDKKEGTSTIDSEQPALEINLPEQADVQMSSENLVPVPTKPVPISKRQLKRVIRDIGMTTRSQKKVMALATVLLSKVNELQSALNGTEREEWIKALELEVDSLLFKTETLVPETPNPSVPHDVIYASIVLKRKMIDEQRVDKYKARIVGCGNQLLNKSSYTNDTFSPTVAMLVHMSLLQLSIFDHMHMATFDTTVAYLHQAYPAELKPLYIRFPRTLALALNLDPDVLYRVKKYIYGLPDAGRAYYLALSEHLQSNGYTKSLADPCLFYKIINGTRTYVWTHVDDAFVSSTDKKELKLFEEIMLTKFPVTANYDVIQHLGISLSKQNDGSLKLTQPKLLAEILEQYSDTGVPSKYPASLNPGSLEETEPIETTRYLNLLGKLMYMVHSRPDISTAIAYASTKSHSPNETDYKRLLKTVMYLKQTCDYGLTLHPNTSSDPSLNVVAYVDASFMSHDDTASQSGYTLSLGQVEPSSFFYSKSTKQKLFATSSTHAEIKSLFELTTTLVFLKHLFDELNRPIKLTMEVHGDNQPMIDLVSSTFGRMGKSKHYYVMIQWLRQQVEDGLIRMNKVPPETNVANVLTKIVTGSEFYRSFHQIMGCDNGEKQ